MAEGLAASGYRIVEVIDRFLPFTMQSRLPTADFMVRAYLALPLAWRVLGKQFLVTGEKKTR
jgi:hypothetical protein